MKKTAVFLLPHIRNIKTAVFWQQNTLVKILRKAGCQKTEVFGALFVTKLRLQFSPQNSQLWKKSHNCNFTQLLYVIYCSFCFVFCFVTNNTQKMQFFLTNCFLITLNEYIMLSKNCTFLYFWCLRRASRQTDIIENLVLAVATLWSMYDIS